MEEIIMQFVESFKGNFWEIILAGSFIVQLLTGNKTEAQKTAKRLAKLKKARDKHLTKAQKEHEEIKKLEGDKGEVINEN